jgi:hypothetical protein
MYSADSLVFTFGGLLVKETDAIRKAIKTSDIVLSPADVLTLGTVDTEEFSGTIFIFDCTVNKSGDVRVTLKSSLAGFTLSPKEGKNTITVTYGGQIPLAYQNTTWESSSESVKFNITNFRYYPFKNIESSGSNYRITDVIDEEGQDYVTLKGHDGIFGQNVYLKKDGSGVNTYSPTDSLSWDSWKKQ